MIYYVSRGRLNPTQSLTQLDIVKMYMHNKNEVLRPKLSKVKARTGQTDIHADRCDCTQYHATFMDVNHIKHSCK